MQEGQESTDPQGLKEQRELPDQPVGREERDLLGLPDQPEAQGQPEQPAQMALLAQQDQMRSTTMGISFRQGASTGQTILSFLPIAQELSAEALGPQAEDSLSPMQVFTWFLLDIASAIRARRQLLD